MLILVAVTISMAINGGLFEKAGKAVGETENAVNKEQELSNGKIEIGGVLYDSIDDYINGIQSAVHNWTRTGDTFTCSHCNTTYEMGQVVNYTPEGKTITTISAQMSGLDKYYTKKSSYPPNANVDANGAQTIEAQSTNWVVLGIENTDGDETYETLLITTVRPVFPATVKGLYFYGAAAYNNGPSEINRICEELYSNSEYGKARGMTIEDVNTALNYSPYGGEYFGLDGTKKTTGNLNTKLKDLPIWNNIKQYGTQTPDGTNTEEALGNYELNGYEYYLNDEATGLINDINDTTSSITTVEKNTIFTYQAYSLASNCVTASVNSSMSPYNGYAYFDVCCVSSVRVYASGWSFISDGLNEQYTGTNFRPVVSLRSKLPEKSTDEIKDPK